MEERPLYKLDELIEQCEGIRRGEKDTLNFPRAILTLAREIEKCIRIKEIKKGMPVNYGEE